MLSYADRNRALRMFEGLACPLCVTPSPLRWSGLILACPRGHGWSNPLALCDDLLHVQRRELDRLERSVGGWLDPSARRT